MNSLKPYDPSINWKKIIGSFSNRNDNKNIKISLSNNEIEDLWRKLGKVEGFDPVFLRYDKYGNVLFKEHRNCKLPLGWELDYIIPISKGGEKNLLNIQIIHFQVYQNKIERKEEEMSWWELHCGINLFNFYNFFFEKKVDQTFFGISLEKYYNEREIIEDNSKIENNNNLKYPTSIKKKKQFPWDKLENPKVEMPQEMKSLKDFLLELKSKKKNRNNENNKTNDDDDNNNNNNKLWYEKYKIYVTKASYIFQSEKDIEVSIDYEALISNRAIRLVKDVERFLIVSFKYKNGNWLKFDNPQIAHSIKYILENEISLPNSRKYKFLCFSSSSLCDKKVWFFQEDKDDKIFGTVQSLINYLGDFKKPLEDGIGKYMSRIGHAFSSTIPIAKIKADEYEIEKDICKEVNGKKYIFTDGCGIISQEEAKKIAIKLDLFDASKKLYIPSVFQIRYAGFKGTLVTAADGIPLGKKIIFRESMKKFDSTLDDLEIVNWTSGRSSTHLNKQIIVLLSSLGIKDEVFLDLLEEYTSKLYLMTKSSQVALSVLSFDENDIFSKEAIKLILAGFDIEDNLILKKLIVNIQKTKFESLKNNFHIPIKESRYLMGVSDPSGKLKEDKIFIYLSNTSGPLVIPKCMITRNPCLHPGDIRVVEVVDCPELRHLKDCVVFPTVGNRPLPDMMAGGDLDGDFFFVCWNEKLIPENLFPPDENDISLPEKKENNPIDYFISYHQQNHLQLLNSIHTIITDRKGAKDTEAIELAKLASKAVDAAKSGNFVEVPSNYNKNLPQPHYNKKKNSTVKYYHSKSILGQLYDTISKIIEEINPKNTNENENENEKLLVEIPNNDVIDKDFERYIYNKEEFEKEITEAKGILKEYNKNLNKAIEKDNLEKNKNNEKGGQYKKLKAIELSIKWSDEVKKHYREVFMEEIENEKQLKQKAYAWYKVCLKNNKTSFASLIIDILCRMKAEATLPANHFAVTIHPQRLSWLKSKNFSIDEEEKQKFKKFLKLKCIN